MACEDGQEDHVNELGVRFNAAIDELRGALGEVGDQRLMVMAGILMTDRLDDAERRLKTAEGDIRDLRDGRRDAQARMEGLEGNFARSLEAAAARIESLAARLSVGSDLLDDPAG